MRELPLERARRSDPGSVLWLPGRAMPTPAALLRTSRLVLRAEPPDPLLLSATDVMPFVAVILSEAKNLALFFSRTNARFFASLRRTLRPKSHLPSRLLFDRADGDRLRSLLKREFNPGPGLQPAEQLAVFHAKGHIHGGQETSDLLVSDGHAIPPRVDRKK